MNYIVPEYYQSFQCKCGECRHSCCEGWPVRISKKEYYHLLGTDCSATLRSRLDCALKLCNDPVNGAYAEVSANWRGICILHREDGLCALQTELGEAYLPEVCRLYPRNTRRLALTCGCSCSNSCEKVIELLMELKEPLHFSETELPFDPKFDSGLTPAQYELMTRSISILQDRSHVLPQRLLTLGSYLNVLASDIVFNGEGSEDNSHRFTHMFQFVKQFAHYYDDSNSVGEYCRASLDYFCLSDQELITKQELTAAVNKYRTATEQLELFLPDWQLLLEQLLVNHMFYNSFPFTNPRDNAETSFLSLVAVYSFLRFNLLMFAAGNPSKEELVDFLAAMFRLIEHSNFMETSVALLKAEKIPVQEFAPELICL